jgi:asparagine synthase (glutamine-hydrolysing)
MSGIFGFINLDGRPASPEHFGAMANEMAPWGPNGIGSIFSGSAAFGHALLVVTHESRFEKMPYCDASEGILFTASARLDNRDELCDIFNIAHPERPTTSDGQLVLKAYKKWGSDSCRHILGDWSFAAWHSREKRIFLARDHLGNTGLFYYFITPFIVFASNHKAILAHPEVPHELDELRLAKNLGLDIQDKDWSRTYWKDICYLPSAHTITITKTDRKIENYWRLDEAPPVRLGSDSDYLEGFLEHFRRAVKVRLNSVRPVGTQLSAGLDSSAITALAAQALQKENHPLVAYTAVPLHRAEKLFPTNLTDEWPLAHQVAQLYGNIEHVSIRAEDITPLEAVKRSLDITRTPQHASSNMVWIISLFENARQRNLGVMLTGQLGNGGVSWSGGRDYIFYLFARNQWRKGLQSLAAWKNHHKYSWFRALKSQILRPLLLPLWSEYQRFLHRTKQIHWDYSFPQKDFIRRMGINGSPKMIFKLKHNDPLTERMLTTIRNGTMVGPLWHSFSAYFNMEVRDPTADVRLLEFCQGVPDEQNTFEGGQRMLIRRAMAGILPDAVRWNNVRGKQAADTIFRLRAQCAEVEQELARFQSAAEVTRYVDIASMNRVWSNLAPSSALANHLMTHALLRAFNTAYFLLANTGEKGKTAAEHKR